MIDLAAPHSCRIALKCTFVRPQALDALSAISICCAVGQLPLTVLLLVLLDALGQLPL